LKNKLVERDELSTILCTVVKVNYYFDRGIIILSTSTRSTLMKSLGPRLGLHHSYSFSREANGRRAMEIRKLLVLKESMLPS